MKLRLMLMAMTLSWLGCYHASVETGRSAGTQKIDKDWAASWLYGLVPPSTVESQTQCKDGVSKVETQHSFLNGLVGGLTLGIYTPISINVTCAAPVSSAYRGKLIPPPLR
jgi:hypothetical protein